MRQIPAVTKNLLIINVLMFAATYVLGLRGVEFNDIFGLHFFLAPDFGLYQLFTYMFMHAGFTHILFNMFALWMFGCVIENVWGAKKFLFYYLTCGVGAGLVQMVAQFCSFYITASEQIPGFGLQDVMLVAHNSAPVLNMWTTVGASGAVYGILLAFGMLFPEERIMLIIPPIPMKAKWFVAVYVVIELVSALGTSGDNVAHFAHLGGMLFGYLMIRHWRRNSGWGGNGGYGGGRDDTFTRFMQNIKDMWQRVSGGNKGRGGNGNRWNSNRNDRWSSSSTHGTQGGNADWDYNAEQKKKQEEVDRILDKVRRSGYDSLTEKEKRTLFDGGKR